MGNSRSVQVTLNNSCVRSYEGGHLILTPPATFPFPIHAHHLPRLRKDSFAPSTHSADARRCHRRLSESAPQDKLIAHSPSGRPKTMTVPALSVVLVHLQRPTFINDSNSAS